jgi:hypothetical protein
VTAPRFHHQWAPDEISADAALFQGELITGPDTIEYEVPALDPGEFYFQCDVHPTMNGTWNAVEGGGGGATGATGTTGETGPTGATGETGGAGVTPTVASGSRSTPTRPAAGDTATTLTFDNQTPGPAQHRDLPELAVRGLSMAPPSRGPTRSSTRSRRCCPASTSCSTCTRP